MVDNGNIWGVPGMGVPQNGWFIENPNLNMDIMDDVGVPLFQKTTVYLLIGYGLYNVSEINVPC